MILGIFPKVDYAFKRLFGTMVHEPILIDLVQAVLGSQLSRPIAFVEVVNPFNEKEPWTTNFLCSTQGAGFRRPAV